MGLVGISFVLELRDFGLDVIVLEVGGYVLDNEILFFYEVDVVGLFYDGIYDGWVCVFGGILMFWGG